MSEVLTTTITLATPEPISPTESELWHSTSTTGFPEKSALVTEKIPPRDITASFGQKPPKSEIVLLLQEDIVMVIAHLRQLIRRSREILPLASTFRQYIRLIDEINEDKKLIEALKWGKKYDTENLA